MKFEGTQSYVATDDLKLAVNAAITLQRPLLVKGEPGTGKTMLAEQLAESFGAKLITWHIKSTTKAHQGLYEYDAVSRLRDSQLGVDKVHDVRNYIKKGKLWEAFEAEERVILLIDEIDKADIEFPNDLLQELDKMEFTSTRPTKPSRRSSARSSSSPRTTRRNCPTPSCAAVSSTTRLPRPRDVAEDRRCALPEHQAVAGQRGAGHLLRRAQGAGLKKKPSTSGVGRLAEAADGRRDRRSGAANAIRPRRSALAGALVKNEQDVQLLERLAFMSRRASRWCVGPFRGKGCGRHARQRRNIPCSAEVACAARYVTRSTRPSNRPAIVIAASAARPRRGVRHLRQRCAARRSAMSPGRTRWRIPLVARRHPYLLPPLRIEPAVAWRQRGPDVHLYRPRHPRLAAAIGSAAAHLRGFESRLVRHRRRPAAGTPI